MPLDYFIWLIKGRDRTYVIDTGFDAQVGRTTFESAPGDTRRSCSRRIGTGPEQISDVIVTHLHYDHAGNRELFSRAPFMCRIGRWRCCHGPMHVPFGAGAYFDVRDISAMVERVFSQRVVFHDGDCELAPGLSLHRIGGHTAGLQIVRVWTRRGWLVLASDASHFYANMEQGRFPIVYNVGDMYEGHRRCYELAGRSENVIPGHDPLVMQRYPVPQPSLRGTNRRTRRRSDLSPRPSRPLKPRYPPACESERCCDCWTTGRSTDRRTSDPAQGQPNKSVLPAP